MIYETTAESAGSRDATSEFESSVSYQLGILDKSWSPCPQFLHFRSQHPRDDSGVKVHVFKSLKGLCCSKLGG